MAAVGIPMSMLNFNSEGLNGSAWNPSSIDPEMRRSSSQTSFLAQAMEETDYQGVHSSTRTTDPLRCEQQRESPQRNRHDRRQESHPLGEPRDHPVRRNIPIPPTLHDQWDRTRSHLARPRNPSSQTTPRRSSEPMGPAPLRDVLPRKPPYRIIRG